MTSKKKVTMFVYSRKGNTTGILELLENHYFDYIFQVTSHTTIEEVKQAFKNSSLIFLGVPTYYPTYQKNLAFPSYLKVFEDIIKGLEGKEIVVFGSGRSEYELFCGAVDYLGDYLSVKNKVHKFKFEGFPKVSEQKYFKRMVEELLYVE
ncbi:flavodoxin [Bacillus phage B4]|uniref:Putative flavodoxin n=2 Tax=Bequatrovirus B4 TaxID=1918005 RepID=J9PWK2_9CAUD|nr:flavodoxin [Bacillus phage B4]AEZ66007.1 putative flavodoxin [Bacillus phage B4]MEB9013796.1 flavodoxin domain-containing protein [Bacillus cereus]MEB9190589.1 flavodoxin domain-containing protein [Bacillus cereus]